MRSDTWIKKHAASLSGTKTAITGSTGGLGREIARGAGERARWYPTVGELCEALPALLRRGDRVLVKASRGMHLEEAAEAVKRLEDA